MGSLEREVTIANPQHPHCATVLIVDTSGSMSGSKIDELNRGLALFRDEVMADELARKRVEGAVVSFSSSAYIAHPFGAISDFQPPLLTADGSTAMGAGILLGLDLLEDRKREYKEKGVDYYRPWVMLITDGAPTDMQPGDAHWNEVVRRVRDGEANKEFLFFGIGVEAADMGLLTQLCPSERPPLKLREGRFRELFQWLSKSQSKVSGTKIGAPVPLEDPTRPSGWAEAQTT